jgi:hypothetical protein
MANCKMPNSNTCDLNNVSTNCIPQELTIENVRLAASYVPYQFLCQLYSPMDSLRLGTAFPELFSPYDAGKRKNNSCGCVL